MTDRDRMIGIIDISFAKQYEKRGLLTAPHTADDLLANGVTVQEWISVKDRLPDKDGQYLIFTTQYFTPDHIDEIDHKDGIEISGYYKGCGFLSANGIYAKYWCRLPQPPKGE